MARPKINREGENKLNKWGTNMIILDYINYHNITIKLEDEHETILYSREYGDFKNGQIKSPYDKTVYDGYIGEGIFPASNSIYPKGTPSYNYWTNMLKRCYDEDYKQKHPTYKEAICCDEWLNFQTFAKWVCDNHYEVNNDIMDLDKDIINKGNKIYSPNNCVFVPHRINALFVKNDKNRGDLPIGVNFHIATGKFRARCNTLDKRISLGLHETPNLAFNEYKIFKESYIKQVADEYKSQIPITLFNAMYNWTVEIND